MGWDSQHIGLLGRNAGAHKTAGVRDLGPTGSYH